MENLDAVIIGSGQGGVPLAKALAEAGWQVALVERGAVGGTCVNTGCTPTKTMVASARVAHLCRQSGDFGVHAGPVTVNVAEVRARKRKIVEQWRGGSESGIRDCEGLELLRGEARFSSPGSVVVSLRDGGTRELHSECIVIDTGCRPRIPGIDGLGDVTSYDNESIMELDEAPEHLLVLGGGYVAVEFAQMFRRFGSEVTIVQRNRHLLPREDAEVSEALEEILRGEGIEIWVRSEAVRVEPGSEHGVRCHIQRDGNLSTLRASHLLVATGRTPNTGALAAEAAGIALDEHGYVRVNERLETTVPGIYAIGDVNGGPAFTHVSYDDFRILKANLLGGEKRSTKGRLIPYTVFTDPQLGRVGPTEAELSERGVAFRIARLPMRSAARAVETGETLGFMKALVDADSGKILSVAVLGVEGGEIASALQMAMLGGLPYTAIRDAMIAHPTLAESLNNLFQNVE